MIDRNTVGLAALTLGLALSGTSGAQSPEPPAVTLMRDHKCYVCHADNDELAGPAFADVAVKYRGDPHAVGVVAARVRRGVQGQGPWHMPPHPEVSPDEAKAIAQYILSIDQRWIKMPVPPPGERPQPATGSAPRS